MGANIFPRLETLTAGVEILAPVLAKHAFRFEGESMRRNPSLVDLGEEVACGEFVRRERRLGVELFYSLGLAIVAGVTVAGYILYRGNTAPVVPTIAAAEVASASKPIVVKLHAQWCVKCLVTKGVWADLEKEYAGRVHLVVMDFTNDATTEASRKEAQRLGLARFFEEFSGVTGIVVVLRPGTKEVAAEIEFSRDLPEYRTAIDAALSAR